MQSHQLCSAWCTWLNFQVPEDETAKVDYSKYLRKVHTIYSYADLAYFWQSSTFNKVHEFLVYEGEGSNVLTGYFLSLFRFEVEGEKKYVSAINYFREGIDPTWEDEKNKFGGRLIFQIDKDNDKHQEIYEWLIFYFLGESESCAEDINGIRFISHKSNAPFKFHYRVEVWTKFNSEEHEKVVEFRDSFVKDFFNEFMSKSNLKNFKPSFKNNEEKKHDEKGDKNENTK